MCAGQGKHLGSQADPSRGGRGEVEIWWEKREEGSWGGWVRFGDRLGIRIYWKGRWEPENQAWTTQVGHPPHPGGIHFGHRPSSPGTVVIASQIPDTHPCPPGHLQPTSD